MELTRENIKKMLQERPTFDSFFKNEIERYGLTREDVESEEVYTTVNLIEDFAERAERFIDEGCSKRKTEFFHYTNGVNSNQIKWFIDFLRAHDIKVTWFIDEENQIWYHTIKILLE